VKITSNQLSPLWWNIKVASSFTRKVWRYQRGNQNPQIKEGQTTQWPKEKRTNRKLHWKL